MNNKYVYLEWNEEDCRGYDLFEIIDGKPKYLVSVFDPKLIRLAIPNTDQPGDRLFTVLSFDMNSGKKKYIKRQNITIKEAARTQINDFPLDAPILQSVTMTLKGLLISWKEENTPQYRVFRRMETERWGKIADVQTNYYLDTDVEVGGEYYYTVRCLDASGHVYLSYFDKAGLKCKYEY